MWSSFINAFGSTKQDARGGDQLNMSNSQSGDMSGIGQGRHHRPSLIGGLFSGGSDINSRQNPHAGDIQMKMVRSQRNSLTGGSERKPEETKAAEEMPTKVLKGNIYKDSNSDHVRKPSVKLRFTSNVEMKDDSGETSMTPLSPGSPNDESSGETTGKQENKPRLQRSKAQSRKTFRLRKSRKSRTGFGETSEKQSYSTPATPTQITPQAQKLLLEQLKEAKLKEIFVRDEIRSREEKGAKIREERGKGSVAEKSSVSSSERVLQGPIDRRKQEESSSGHPPHQSHFQHQPTGFKRGNPQKAELSVDEDASAVSQTSSTSGYRESYSLITMTMESPTLQRPSSLPATTSPESSLTSIDGDETALLARSSSSQHSLTMLFETQQDEDTLI